MKVILYHQDSCPQCRMLKTLLDKKKVNYESVKDIKKMLDIGISHTPTLEVDGRLMGTKEAMAWINRQ